MGSRLLASALASAVLCTTNIALPDSFSSYRSDQLVEREHTIAITMHPSHAELVVRRTAYNGGDRSDEATYYIDVPGTAVATGLRTLASLNGRPHWYDGDLMEAEAAAAKYRELTGIGGYYPKDPALLSWRSQSLLALQVFPCLPHQEKTVEYTLIMPTTYSGGARHIRLPRLGTETHAAVLTARVAGDQGRLLVDGLPEKNGAKVLRRVGADAETDVAIVPRDPPLIDGELVALPMDDRRVVTHYAVRVAPKVAEVPRGAWLAIVVDGSRSTPDGFGRSARAALDGYLSHFDRATRVELFVFDRKVVPRYGRFAAIRDVQSDLAGWEPRRANGSDVDAALLAAAEALAKAPKRAARRILLLTDGHVKKDLTPERIRGVLAGSDAVAHVGLLREGAPVLERLDGHEWATAMRTTGGLVWNAEAGNGTAADATRVFEEWARPVRLDHVRLYSADLPMCDSDPRCAPDGEPPEVIDEGEGIDRIFIAERKAAWLRVEGELWAKRVDRTLREDPREHRLWAASVFGTAVLDELTEAEMMPLAMLAGAVSPVTSYLAIEPGVRPSIDGLEQRGVGFGLLSGSLGRGAMTSVSGTAPPIDRDAFLRDALGSAWRRCGGAPGTASVTLEMTLAEIVKVTTLGTVDPILSRCLTEAAWDIVLPPQFDEEWTIWSTNV